MLLLGREAGRETVGATAIQRAGRADRESVAAVDHGASQSHQRLGLRHPRLDERTRFGDLLAGGGARRVESDEAGVGELALLRVVASSFAHQRGIALDIEHVVPLLEGVAHEVADALERLDVALVNANGTAPGGGGERQQIARLAAVDAVEKGHAVLALRGGVVDLAAHHAARAGVQGKEGAQILAAGLAAPGQDGEDLCQQRVASQDGHGLAKFAVTRRQTAPEVVVVHGRQVVVDERVGVDHLDGDGRVHDSGIVARGGTGKGLGGGQDDEGAQALATGQKAVATVSKKDVANFKLRKKMPIGVRVTLRRERMYEFLEKLVRVALPRIRDFKGIESKLDGRGNYTLGIQEQIIFPEINIDAIDRILGMNITFVTTAQTDEEGYALLKEFGLPFKNAKNDK